MGKKSKSKAKADKKKNQKNEEAPPAAAVPEDVAAPEEPEVPEEITSPVVDAQKETAPLEEDTEPVPSAPEQVDIVPGPEPVDISLDGPGNEETIDNSNDITNDNENNDEDNKNNDSNTNIVNDYDNTNISNEDNDNDKDINNEIDNSNDLVNDKETVEGLDKSIDLENSNEINNSDDIDNSIDLNNDNDNDNSKDVNNEIDNSNDLVNDKETVEGLDKSIDLENSNEINNSDGIDNSIDLNNDNDNSKDVNNEIDNSNDLVNNNDNREDLDKSNEINNSADIDSNSNDIDEQPESQPPEDWSMIAPHQPTVEDDAGSMKSKKHSPAPSVSGKSAGTAAENALKEEADTFEDAKDGSDEVVESVDPGKAPEALPEEKLEDPEAATETAADAEHEEPESAAVQTAEEKQDGDAPESTDEAPETSAEEPQESDNVVPEEPVETAVEKDAPTDQPEVRDEPEQPAESEHQDHPENVLAETAEEMSSSKHSIAGATHAGPAPLPSPVPSEPRSVHSPVPPDHPLSRHGSPLAYHTSPQYRYVSPTMQAYNPYMMGMPPQSMNPGSMHQASVAPSSASFATAYHSPMMEHTPMASPHMYPRRASTFVNGARDYYNGRMDRTLSNGSGNSHVHSQRMEKSNSHNNNDDDHQEHHHLMGRVEKAMPDITRMLDSFKETRQKLQAREAEARQLQAQHEQAIMHKDFYIEALQGQMKKAATEAAEEYGKFREIISSLRVDISSQQEKIKELQDYLDTSRKQNEDLESIKSELEAEIQTLQKRIEELQLDHERALEEAKEHERTELAMQKEELTNLFEEIRTEDETAANERYNEREKELLDEQEALKSAWEEKHRGLEEVHANMKTEHEAAIGEKHAELERTLAELEAAKNDLQTVRDSLVSKSEDLETKEKELETTKTELETKLQEIHKAQDDLHYKQEELQATQAELQSTLEELVVKKAELEGKHTELEEAHKRHAEEKGQLIGSHFTELDNLRDMHSTELTNLRTTHEANAKELQDRLEKLAKDFEEKERTWAAEKSMLQRQLHEKLDELAGIEREKDALERDDVIREKHLQAAVEEMRRTIDNMENDREKLRKTLQSLGEATDLKSSKGDQFFVDAFGQLRRLIVELSKDHFSYLPIDPPKDILEKIPPEMPSFLDNTAASRELRSAYIQHVVSKTLTYRIFQPFLFTLGRRYDKADTFFQVLSMDIRRKSVRREAFWRQQTLKAAYTTSDAKQSINVVAAVIVDEIVDHIKHFADPKQLDALLSGIRRIVKLAAETWRHARVERELVLATMPAPESDSDVNEGWEEYTCGRPLPDPSSSGSASGRHVLLRVFPRIYREAAHEDFADDKEKMNACVYFPGSILYSDSPSVLARREEQGQKSGSRGSVNGDSSRSPTP
ncbi:conserved hypothetical protein [Talaromyces stipitatus ATCC 10500]|uniref:RNA polymerase Rpb1 C-terminal repeat domain protein n=1 Tax=Talaromyces stipitatus (strain ATCC 10500 / CBS 375.48 / QM 6759 / NRRL 1006) TaxID=441959 RepID=B8MDY2_TALSN|nr:uncharacterized protein TSTA_011680 [Talaromyces stipitatus ATCC 10500]EED16059.1 conserved hypothetical protein [Talaromyces stipitatus ATCC 10500]